MSLLGRGNPQLPPWLFFLKIGILVLSVIVLAMSAWSLSLYLEPLGGDFGSSDVGSIGDGGFGLPDLGDNFIPDIAKSRSIKPRSFTDLPTDTPKSAPALLLFAILLTMFFIIALVVMERVAPVAVFRLPVFVTYIVSAILLLSGWAFMAAYASPMADVAKVAREFDSNSYSVKLYSAIAAATALGAITWTLLLVDAIVWTLACLRDPGSEESYGMGTVVQPSKMEAPPMNYAPQGYPPQTTMPAQPYAT